MWVFAYTRTISWVRTCYRGWCYLLPTRHHRKCPDLHRILSKCCIFGHNALFYICVIYWSLPVTVLHDTRSEEAFVSEARWDELRTKVLRFSGLSLIEILSPLLFLLSFLMHNSMQPVILANALVYVSVFPSVRTEVGQLEHETPGFTIFRKSIYGFLTYSWLSVGSWRFSGDAAL